MRHRYVKLGQHAGDTAARYLGRLEPGDFTIIQADGNGFLLQRDMLAGSRYLWETRHGQTYFTHVRAGDLKPGGHLLTVLFEIGCIEFPIRQSFHQGVCRPRNSRFPTGSGTGPTIPNDASNEHLCEHVRVVESILMETEQVRLPPPPGLFASLMRGFDSVANHILVILPPVLLDLFLWLGPHLRLKSFLQPFVDQLPALAKAFPSNFPDVATVQSAWTSVINQFNLFMVLRTFPVGATSLLSLEMPGQTPLGIPANLDAGSFIGIFSWALLLVLLGWLIGAIYYFWISGVALKPDGRSLWRSIKQTMFLSIIWLGVLFVFGLPVVLVISMITYFSPILGQIMFFIGALLLIWLIMPVFFSVHGIFTLQLDAFRSILGSLRMVRFTLPNTGLFLLVFVIINTGMNFLWNTPSENSWWMLVGIAGHAFVSTALLAASFIYYRDINAWLSVVLDQLQKRSPTAKAN